MGVDERAAGVLARDTHRHLPERRWSVALALVTPGKGPRGVLADADNDRVGVIRGNVALE